MKRAVVNIIFLASCFLSLAHAGQALSKEAIAKRLAPVGKVKVALPATPTAEKPPITTLASHESNTRSAKDIYNSHCQVCHNAGIAGAPKFRDKSSWGKRLDKGLDALTKSAIAGINAMPAKGTCMTCPEQDIKAAIEYMLPEKT